MGAIKFVVHVGRKSGVQNDVGGLDTAALEIKQQFPGKRAAGGWHFGRAGLFRVNSLVIIKVPWRRDVLVPDRFSQPVDQIDESRPGNREVQFPKTRDVRVARQHGGVESFREFDLHSLTLSAAEWIALLAKKKGQPGIV